MELLGLIKRFGTYNITQLEQMKRDLKLEMPIQALQFASTHYRMKERRDPQIDELMLWDRFFALMSSDISAVAPTELLTNDAFVAQTHADLMKKRELCHPNAKTPCSFGEALQTINSYLSRIGKYTETPQSQPILEERPHLAPFSLDENVFSPTHSNFRIRLLSHQEKYDATDDCMVLFARGEKQSNAEYQAALNEFLALPAVTDQILRLQMIDSCGMLKAVLSVAAGAWINLSCLSRTGESVPLSLLADGYEGTYLARIQKESLKDIYRFAADKGLSVVYFADALSAPTLRITRVNKQTLSVESQFLRTLPILRPITTRLSVEEPHFPLSLTNALEASVKNIYLDFQSQASNLLATRIDNMTVSSASSRPDKSFFLHALYTALAPVCALAVCGCDYSKQLLSVGINAPDAALDDVTAGEIYSTILGIYRVQAELALPSFSNRLVRTNRVSHPTTTVFALANSHTAIPNVLQNEENRLYLVSAPIDESGIPVFQTLRKLLNEISAWSRAGKIQSAFVIFGKTPTDALDGMSKNGLAYHLTDEKIAGEGELPLAFLIEASEELPLSLIGSVCKKESLTESTTSVRILRKPSLIWSEKTRITVLASQADIDARMLTAILKKKGADAEIFFAEKEEYGPLSRSILGSEILLICKDARLPDEKEIRFAITVMKKAGGMCVSFEKDIAHAELALPNGLSKENLDIICAKIKKD